MELLIFAHRGEAQEFIKRFSFKPQDPRNSIYQAQDKMLLITGEGIYEVFSLLGYVLGKYPISKVINLGIAGALDPKLPLNEIVPIRTVYCHSDRMQFQSFTLADQTAKLDAITSSERVIEDDQAKKLACFAPIVDRELWAAAKTCAKFNTPLYAHKLLSDIAGASTNCFDLKEKAKEFSAALMAKYISLDHEEIAQVSMETPTQMSFTQKARYQKNLQSLRLSPGFDERIFLKNLQELLNDEALSSKQKANALLEKMELELNPVKQKTKASFEKLAEPATRAGANIFFDKNFEKKKFTLQMEINHQKNLDNLRECLSSLDFADFEKVWNGQMDV